MNINMENIKDFVKDIFTLRTVWIDRGSGKWVVKKRFHPLLRTTFWVLSVIVCAGVYTHINNPLNSEAVANQPVVLRASLPEPEQILPPSVPAAQMVIPLKTSSKIVLPSEENPETDRIITPSANKNETQPVPKLKAKRSKDGKYNVFINKSDYTLTLFDGNDPVKVYPIAVGKNPGDKQRVGDNRTPVGKFKVVSIENSSKWTHDFRDGKGKIKGAYGPWFLRLDAKGWKGIGIHGTHDPDSIGTDATEGCIRLRNEDIADLRQYAKTGMPVIISENEGEIN